MDPPLGPSIALTRGMRLSALRYSAAGKAVWGRAVTAALLASLLLSAVPAQAGGPQSGTGKALTAQQQARIARRHAKLDLQLNDAVEDAVNGESNVIIEFNDERIQRSISGRSSTGI